MSARASRAVATTLTLLTTALVVGAVALYFANTAKAALEPLGFNGVASMILVVTLPTIGWLIASRRRENRIGWMLLTVGFLYALTQFSATYAAYGLVADPGSLPLADVMSWLTVLAWVPAFVLFILLLLFFPDGRLPSRRWRPVVWIASVALVVMVVPDAIALWPYRGPLLLTADVASPANDPAPAVAGTLLGVGLILSLTVAVAGVGALVIRFRRAAGTEHQQIKWFASAAVAEVTAIFVTTGVVLPPPLDALAAIIVAPLIPIAVGVAILRFRLYEIDRIISRTIAYAAVTGVLVLTFAGAILLFQAVLAPLTGENTVAVAASTLVVAALFQPLRGRVQGVVDRRFNRARYDAERTAGAFAARLRDQVDLGALGADLVATVEASFRPRTAEIWVAAPREPAR